MHLIEHLIDTRKQTIHTKYPVAHTIQLICSLKIQKLNEMSVCLQCNRSIRFNPIDFDVRWFYLHTAYD